MIGVWVLLLLQVMIKQQDAQERCKEEHGSTELQQTDKVWLNEVWLNISVE